MKGWVHAHAANRIAVVQFLKFGFAGVLNTLFSLAVYWLLLLVLKAQIAYMLSYASGILLSYALSTRFVFKVGHTWKRVLLFPLVYLLAYGIGAFVLYMSVEKMGIDAWIAPVLSIAVTLPLTFVLTRLLMRDSPVNASPWLPKKRKEN